jgi:magnesium-transporting ATPase (P-type)
VPCARKAIGIYALTKLASTIFMVTTVDLLNIGTGVIILVLVIFANFYQFRVRRRFSGVIGKIMFWYSLGLVSILALTIFNWVAFTLNMDLVSITLADRVFDIAAVACFLKGAMVIR